MDAGVFGDVRELSDIGSRKSISHDTAPHGTRSCGKVNRGLKDYRDIH